MTDSMVKGTDPAAVREEEEWETAELQCNDYATAQDEIQADELCKVTRALQEAVLDESEFLKEALEPHRSDAPKDGSTSVEAEQEPSRMARKPAPIDTATPDVGDPMTASSQPSTPVPELPAQGKKPQLTVVTGEVYPPIQVSAGGNMADYMTPPTPGVAPSVSKHQDEETEGDYANSNSFSFEISDFRSVGPNLLGPREQEIADDVMMQGMNAFFNNKFSKARVIFEARAKDDPLFALGLGSMAFIKAIASSETKDMEMAIVTLSETYQFASAQIEAASARKPLKDTVSHYISNIIGSNTTHLPTNTRPLKQEELNSKASFLANGALRAHVIRAECSLLMSIIYLSQETVLGYLRAGLCLRRAYSSYSLVWQEYKRMGQDFNKHMDRDTISGIQFGIGTVHLLLSSLPPRVLRVVSAFGWKADRHLGFALLKLCMEGKRIRSPLASLALLAYYTQMTWCAPSVLSRELVHSAIEVLLDAQQSFPNSAFFLYFAGHVSRLSKNLSLSIQSFTYANEVTQGDWAENMMGHLTLFEIALNHAMALDWASAAACLQELQGKGGRSPAFVIYFYGACMEMAGDRMGAILAFAEAAKLVENKKRLNQLDHFVARRIEFFAMQGYQDLQYSLPALEILLMWNAFINMSEPTLEASLERIDATLDMIYEREKQEYAIRVVELVPHAPIPNYVDQRGALLVTKASILNALGRSKEAIMHLNWVIDHKEGYQHTQWIVPYAYWESGVTSWSLQDQKHSRALWETAQLYSGYDFEYRHAMRLNMVITHAIELGVQPTPAPKPEKGLSTHGRKRLSLVARLTGSTS